MKQPLVNNLFDLSGKKILITGASSGIGREIAVMAAQHGAEVIISGRNTERLAETIELIGRNTIAITADLTNEDDIKNLVSQLPDIGRVLCRVGRIHTPEIHKSREDKAYLFPQFRQPGSTYPAADKKQKGEEGRIACIHIFYIVENRYSRHRIVCFFKGCH